ncbi:hypothetical protein [Armatimonas sp.]|uniref:hypothetical protein n=1 Tax=Armatimonas sp. TaxID=1872638 RepID=UPI00286A6126|nr:hypothetical protein [Armatimonas sp.]
MKAPEFLRRFSRNGVASKLEHEAPSVSSSAISAAVASVLAEHRDDTEPAEVTEQRVTSNPNPRNRDKYGNILSRGAWVDLPILAPDVPIENTELSKLLTTLCNQGRTPTASQLSFLYNRSVLETIQNSKKLFAEAQKRVDQHNQRAVQDNAALTSAEKDVLLEREEALIGPRKRAIICRGRADLADQIAAARAGEACVGYSVDDPNSSTKEYRDRNLLPAVAAQELAKAKGDQAEAEHLLEALTEPQELYQEPATEKALEIVGGKIWRFLLAIFFGLAVFTSIMTASGILGMDDLLSGKALSNKPLVLLFYLPAALGGSWALGHIFHQLGMPAGATYFRQQNEEIGPRFMKVGAGFAILSITIDAAIHWSSFVKSAGILALNSNTQVGLGQQVASWLMAMFFVFGYVLYEFGSGIVSQWHRADAEIKLLKYQKHLHQKRLDDLHERIAKAKQVQATALGKSETAPLFKAIGTDRVYQRVARSCNRAVVLKAIATQAEAAVKTLEQHYEAQLLALESRRTRPRETFFEDDIKRVEEGGYAAQLESEMFRRRVARLTHETEYPWLLQWVRRWFWFWNPFWMWGRHRL